MLFHRNESWERAAGAATRNQEPVMAVEAGEERLVMDNKETKKLDAEELENRVAPGTLYVVDPVDGGGETAPGEKGKGKDAK